MLKEKKITTKTGTDILTRKIAQETITMHRWVKKTTKKKHQQRMNKPAEAHFWLPENYLIA